MCKMPVLIPSTQRHTHHMSATVVWEWEGWGRSVGSCPPASGVTTGSSASLWLSPPRVHFPPRSHSDRAEAARLEGRAGVQSLCNLLQVLDSAGTTQSPCSCSWPQVMRFERSVRAPWPWPEGRGQCKKRPGCRRPHWVLAPLWGVGCEKPSVISPCSLL